MAQRTEFVTSRRAVLLVVLVCGAVLSANEPTKAQDLEQLRHDVRSPPARDTAEDSSEESRDKRKPRSDCDDPWYEDCSLSELFGRALFYTFTTPFWGPHIVLGDSFQRTSYFARYPYVDDVPGHLVIGRYGEAERYDWTLRARSEYADDFDRMSRVGGHVLFDTVMRVGIDSEFNWRSERLPGGGYDDLWTGDFNIVYRFAQREDVQMRAGLGVNWLADSEGSDLGFNFTYGGDWFPCRPWVLSAELDWGTLGHAGLFHGRVTAGLEWHGVEIYAGYDYFDVGSTQFDGPLAGVRIWY